MDTSFYLYLDKKALESNINYLREQKKKDILPVIKANAYGHGILEIAKALYQLQIKTFAVARLYEALDVIEYLNSFDIKDFQVLVFESINDIEILKEHENIIATINNISDLKVLIANNLLTERLAIKIDLGFGRNGLNTEDIEVLKTMMKFNKLKFHSIFSHLFSATYEDGLDIINNFSELVRDLGKENFKMIHLQNAASIYNYDCEIVTHLRTGMLLYGLQEPGFYDHSLKQVHTSLEGKIDSVRYIDQMKYVAYEDFSILSSGAKKIAKIKIGYGDGFLKCNNNTYCLIKKKEYKIIQVTMDNTFIEVDDRVNVGDVVRLYHRPNEMKEKVGMGILELLINLSPIRIKRLFIEEKR